MMRAFAIARAIEDGETTPAAAIGACQRAAVERTDLRVYAHDPQTLEAAPAGPLRGIGMGVKDIFDTFDMPTAHGSPIYKGHQPPRDAALVAMVRQAGGTVTGKTVTTEFAWFTPGATRNPHDPAHTPGGSSSGSAAGVAAGMFPAALGSQTGGSVIRPAAFCGVTGYKPSFRLLPTVGMGCFSWSLDTAGLFAASVQDVAFVAAAITGRDLATEGSPPPRIAILRSSIDEHASPAMLDAWDRAARLCERKGAQVRYLTLPHEIDAARFAHDAVQRYEAPRALAHERRCHAARLSDRLRDYLDDAAGVEAASYDDARRQANRARKAMHEVFAQCDVALVPAAPGAAPKGLSSTGDSVFNRLWTLMGVPCVSVTAGRDGTLPLGLQVLAPFGRDRECLAAAAWIEKAVGP